MFTHEEIKALICSDQNTIDQIISHETEKEMESYHAYTDAGVSIPKPATLHGHGSFVCSFPPEQAQWLHKAERLRELKRILGIIPGGWSKKPTKDGVAYQYDTHEIEIVSHGVDISTCDHPRKSIASVRAKLNSNK
jgi:hypothetical protein